MAAALQWFATLGGHPSPHRSPGVQRPAEAAALSLASNSSCAFPFQTPHVAIVPGLPPPSLPFIIRGKCLHNLRPSIDRRFPVHVTFAAPQEDSKQSNIDMETVKDELRIKANESLKAWKQMLESLKADEIKMQGVLQEAYEIYSKRAVIVFQETSQKIKVHADQARYVFTKLAIEICEEGRVYLSTAAKNSPEFMRDIVETFACSTDELKDVSKLRDFYLGIPYGAFLAIGGFLHFMLTESISAIRFGVILGSALLALSVSSLRAWKRGKSSAACLKGQAAIAAIIFIREWNLLYQRLSFTSSLMAFISGAMLAFYVYRLIIDGQSKGPNLEQTQEN